MLNGARHGGLAQRVKWAGERHVLPRLRDCVESRNEALRAAEACLVSLLFTNSFYGRYAEPDRAGAQP